MPTDSNQVLQIKLLCAVYLVSLLNSFFLTIPAFNQIVA